MCTDVQVGLNEAQGKGVSLRSQQAPPCSFHSLSLPFILCVQHSLFSMLAIFLSYFLSPSWVTFIYSLSPFLYPSLLHSFFLGHCLHFTTPSSFGWLCISDFGPVVDVKTFTEGPLMGLQGRVSSSRDWVSTESLDDWVPFKSSLSNHSPRILAN